MSAFIYQATYDSETKKINASELVSFEGEKIINDVIGLYNNPDSQSANNFFSQIYNRTDNKYQLKGFKRIGDTYEKGDIRGCDSDSIFE